MNWNEFAAEVHQNAVDHGWWEPRPSSAQIVVMCHSEISGAVEEYRKGMPMLYYPCNAGGLCEDDKTIGRMDCGSRVYNPETPDIPCKAKSKKPCGVAVKMGDCILRILDVLVEAGVDIDAGLGFAPTAKDLIETVANCHVSLVKSYIKRDSAGRNHNLLMCMETILEWARLNDVDMEAVLRAKHEYNKTRPFRHGDKKL